MAIIGSIALFNLRSNITWIGSKSEALPKRYSYQIRFHRVCVGPGEGGLAGEASPLQFHQGSTGFDITYLQKVYERNPGAYVTTGHAGENLLDRLSDYRKSLLLVP